MGEDLTDLFEDDASLGEDADELEGSGGGGRGGSNQQQTSVSIRIHTEPLRRAASDLRGLGRVVAEEFDKGLRAYAEDVAEHARQRARSIPRVGPGTDRIANSIRVNGAGTTLRVVAGGAKAPEAAPIDNGGRAGSFRHPVFGNTEVWVNQSAHPFLEPTADDLTTADTIAGQAIDRALRSVGFG